MSAFLAGALAGGAARTALIVVPTTLLDQWAVELQSNGLDRQVHVCGAGGGSRTAALGAVSRRGGVLITSYGMVLHHATDFGATDDADDRKDNDDEESPIRWDWLICDEGHKLKNARMKLVDCMQRLPATRRLVLTGTPVQNNLTELWALLNFAAPGLLGDAKSFREQYEKPIARGASRDASARERQVGAATAEALRRKMAPVLLRREKSVVFGITAQTGVDDVGPPQAGAPSAGGGTAAVEAAVATAPRGGPACAGLSSRKVDMCVWLKLTAPQRRLYAAFLSSSSVAAALNKTRSALAAISVLKKICDHPGLLSEKAAAEIARGHTTLPEDACDGQAACDAGASAADDDAADGELDPDASCKTAFVLHFVAAVRPLGHRTLVFSQSVRMLGGLEAALRCAGHDTCRIDGRVPAGERARRVAQFQREDIPVFLLSSAVGGVGLTLTAADRVIIVDPAWNPAADAQSVDRAYRMGQTRDVAVYRLFTAGTVEEKIYRKQVFKAGLSVATSGPAPGGGDVARYFTSGELRDLFACHPAGLDTPATAQTLLARHGPPQERAPADIAQEVAATVMAQACVAAVTDHSVLFMSPDTTAAGPGELHPPVSSSSSSSCSASGVVPVGDVAQPAQRQMSGPPAPWRGGNSAGLAASMVQLPTIAAISTSAAPPSAEDLAAAAARRTAVRVGELQQQIQRYTKLLLDPVTARLPDGGTKVRFARVMARGFMANNAHVGACTDAITVPGKARRSGGRARTTDNCGRIVEEWRQGHC